MVSLKRKILYKLPIVGNYYKMKKSHLILGVFDYVRFVFFCRNRLIYWPRYKTNIVSAPENIVLGKNCSIGNLGCYVQGRGKLIIGDYVRIAMNVGILSGNHNLYDHSKKDTATTIIGDYCWIGMNSMILPGVELGVRTVVAAGAVVTKSFPGGYCVIGGSPARFIKKIEKDKFIPPSSEFEFVGYIPAQKFAKYKSKYLE